jgi:peroxiredoxin
MKFLGRFRWPILTGVILLSATAGLLVGKVQEKNYLGSLYARTDFTLLDDKGEFFQLAKFPSTRLLLLVFTPDEISPRLVPPFAIFSRKLKELEKTGVDPMMVTRTNREIARNFKEAAGFTARLLVDTSGSVGRNIGIWADLNPVSYWGYALIDNKMQVYWASKEPRPLTFEELLAEFKKVSDGDPKASSSTSSDSP